MVATFSSIKTAKALCGGNIGTVLAGNRRSAGGYGWRYTATPLPPAAPSPLTAASAANGTPPAPSPLDKDAALGMIGAVIDLSDSPPPHSKRGGAAAASPAPGRDGDDSDYDDDDGDDGDYEPLSKLPRR